MIPNTFAWDVGLSLIKLTAVLELRKCKALTPYHPDTWYSALWEVGLTQKYSHIVTGLCFGFNISFPTIITTQSPPNKESVIEFAGEFQKIKHKEIQKGRYIGTISGQDVEFLIDPFQSSPFSIIPKPGQANKYCNIQNYSFPIAPSDIFPNSLINSHVDSNSIPTTWGTFLVISLLIHCLPPGLQSAMKDIVEAYRTIPLHH